MKLINLLPKPRQEELRYQKMLSALTAALWFSLASFIMVFLLQLGVKIYLQSRQKSIQAEIGQLKSQVDKQENAQIKQQIKDINSRITDFKNLSDSAPKWSKVLKAFAVLPPPGTKINGLTIDLAKKSINISGFGDTREAVIALYESVKQDSQQFFNIDYPLENVAKPTDVNFHFTFYIKDDLLK
jgi:Tfp pilus assembly protein PilN